MGWRGRARKGFPRGATGKARRQVRGWTHARKCVCTELPQNRLAPPEANPRTANLDLLQEVKMAVVAGICILLFLVGCLLSLLGLDK